MKKNVMTLAVAGAVAASAQAQMYVNPDNTGEVLIYPFYSADNGNQTYIHVVNTTDHAKAAKVRILEAENSVEVRDFNLYLSPKDHFSFAISLDESGAGKLATGDNSCTVPAIPEGGIEFTNMLFSKDENASLERTLNGYVEIIEMGQFDKGKVSSTAANAQDAAPGWYWDHGTTGVPNDCAAVVAMWASNGTWFSERTANGNRGITGRLTDWTGGGLYGMGIIVNPEDGAAVGYDAVAIDSFVDAALANDEGTAGTSGRSGAELHYYPGSTDPGLQGNTQTEDRSSIFLDGAVLTQEYVKGTGGAERRVSETLDAVSSLMMAETVSNDYVLDPFFAGTTDWVVTFPTKRLYVKADNVTESARAERPFWTEWDKDTSCDPYRITVYDREEQTPTPDEEQPPFSPYVPGVTVDPKICYEANVLTYTGVGVDADSPLLGTEPSASGARIQTVVETPYDNGWAEVNFNRQSLFGTYTGAVQMHTLTSATTQDTTEKTMRGLPAVGFSVIAFGNDSVQGGVLANYAAAHEHKITRAVS